MKKKILVIVAAIAILFGVGVTVQKTENEARIPVGGGSQFASIPVGGTSATEVAYIPVGGTSATIGSYPTDSNSTDTGTMTTYSIPVGGT